MQGFVLLRFAAWSVATAAQEDMSFPDSAPEHLAVIEFAGGSGCERGMLSSLLYRTTCTIEGWLRGLKTRNTAGRRVLLLPADPGYGKCSAFAENLPDSHLIPDIKLPDVMPAHGE